jgi:hypothetical protein
MNWFSILSIALKLAVSIVPAIDKIATSAHSGADKKHMAMEAVAQGAGIAKAFLSPEDQAKADTISGIVSQTIDSVVESNKAAGNTAQKITGSAATILAAGIGIAQQAGA